ncbi:CYTH domain-containing protein [Lutibacter sp.]|uniref:CYTH domain-containing protein n=1 Tax=Lutibacter sp. TaxID=1925666 RepID=UPI001A1D61C1|nr:CYTH domain-containing protein [Lutibacter sp.]MBI9040020.1 CYTH domain-containing protein [Lutibacter sp.]
MSVEIERKFLVKGDYKKFTTSSYKISQGFLSSDPERTVRVRVRDTKGFITVKGISNNSGTTRFEWEKEISLPDAENLLAICEPSIITKIRHIVPTTNNLFFEVDEFMDKNDGLVIAEIELPDENFIFEKPIWLGKEVTGEIKYFNSVLSKNPFSNW